VVDPVRQVLLAVGEAVSTGWSAIADGVLEVPVVSQGVAHILVVLTLGFKDHVQRPRTAAWRATGSGCWWPSGVHFLSRPLILELVLLLVYVFLWRWGVGFMFSMRSWACSSVMM
jgi:hypothetical protein